jgi:hypothetical protein
MASTPSLGEPLRSGALPGPAGFRAAFTFYDLSTLMELNCRRHFFKLEEFPGEILEVVPGLQGSRVEELASLIDSIYATIRESAVHLFLDIDSILGKEERVHVKIEGH